MAEKPKEPDPRTSTAPVTRIDEHFSMGMGAADFNTQQLARLNALMRGEPEEPSVAVADGCARISEAAETVDGFGETLVRV